MTVNRFFSLFQTVLLFLAWATGNDCNSANLAGIKEPDTLQVVGKNETGPWSVSFIKNENYQQGPFEGFFDLEVFIDNVLTDQITTKPEYVNKALTYYQANFSIDNKMSLVLLNPSFTTLLVRKNSNITIHSTEEIILTFMPGQQSHYSLQPLDPLRELTDHYFFYVENSGGIENLGFLRNLLDSLAHKGNPFLVYYYGPAQPLIINNPDDISRLYNILFTSITQAPDAHEELRRVQSAFHTHLPDKREDINFHVYFFISEISYYHLNRRFLTPLLEERFPDNGFGSREVYIYTDFDIANKNKGYQYHNISINK